MTTLLPQDSMLDNENLLRNHAGSSTLTELEKELIARLNTAVTNQAMLQELEEDLEEAQKEVGRLETINDYLHIKISYLEEDIRELETAV